MRALRKHLQLPRPIEWQHNKAPRKIQQHTNTKQTNKTTTKHKTQTTTNKTQHATQNKQRATQTYIFFEYLFFVQGHAAELSSARGRILADTSAAKALFEVGIFAEASEYARSVCVTFARDIRNTHFLTTVADAMKDVGFVPGVAELALRDDMSIVSKEANKLAPFRAKVLSLQSPGGSSEAWRLAHAPRLDELVLVVAKYKNILVASQFQLFWLGMIVIFKQMRMVPKSSAKASLKPLFVSPGLMGALTTPQHSGLAKLFDNDERLRFDKSLAALTNLRTALSQFVESVPGGFQFDLASFVSESMDSDASRPAAANMLSLMDSAVSSQEIWQDMRELHTEMQEIASHFRQPFAKAAMQKTIDLLGSSCLFKLATTTAAAVTSKPKKTPAAIDWKTAGAIEARSLDSVWKQLNVFEEFVVESTPVPTDTVLATLGGYPAVKLLQVLSCTASGRADKRRVADIGFYSLQPMV